MLKAARCRAQVYHSMGQAAQGIVKEKGVLGLYRGVGVTLLEIIPYAALQFGLYDAFTSAYTKARHSITHPVQFLLLPLCQLPSVLQTRPCRVHNWHQAPSSCIWNEVKRCKNDSIDLMLNLQGSVKALQYCIGGRTQMLRTLSRLCLHESCLNAVLTERRWHGCSSAQGAVHGCRVSRCMPRLQQ